MATHFAYTLTVQLDKLVLIFTQAGIDIISFMDIDNMDNSSCISIICVCCDITT